MQTFKANSQKAEDSNVRALAKQLLDNNAAAAAAKKNSDDAKAGLGKWLLEQRGFNPATLQKGESILIQVDNEDVLRLDVSERPKMVSSGEKNLCLFYKPNESLA